MFGPLKTGFMLYLPSEILSSKIMDLIFRRLSMRHQYGSLQAPVLLVNLLNRGLCTILSVGHS
jgi:hypothetical protein